MDSSHERIPHEHNYQKRHQLFQEYVQILLSNGSIYKFWFPTFQWQKLS